MYVCMLSMCYYAITVDTPETNVGAVLCIMLPLRACECHQGFFCLPIRNDEPYCWVGMTMIEVNNKRRATWCNNASSCHWNMHLFIGATRRLITHYCAVCGGVSVFWYHTLNHCSTVVLELLKEILPSHTILNHCSTVPLELVNEIFQDVTQKKIKYWNCYQGNHVVVLLVSRWHGVGHQ